ncbi:MAG TPA: methylmalonyl-CoA mutase family protein [Planctomycetota bacterium]|nr:methylmalonyl-CoA mutase family protein [Planctomycetota bacterium]
MANDPQKSERAAQTADFTTISGAANKPVYMPADIAQQDYDRDLNLPGEFPYTRGIHATMYRGRLWTMRQFAGFGTAEETNQRFKYLLSHGQTGLSVAFDFPTLMGYDSDHSRSRGEVGRCGVAISSTDDMERLFAGIPMDKVSTSMTINGPAAMLFAFYLAAAERQGVPLSALRGTIQNDILKEYHAQNSWLVGPEPSLRIITDIFKYASVHAPQWNTISISGYHIREAGSTAAQELAFTLADGLFYVDEGVRAGLNIDEFAGRLSFFFDVHIEFFEEIAKLRAARRVWAREMKKRGAQNPRSLLLRTHAQTAGVSLTAQQPENNIVRTAIEALAAVLGGTQSLHTNSFDEALALPTEKAVQIALRTQQIIAHESGVANVIDPLGGSYYMEALTDRLEAECYAYFKRIEELGGMFAAIDSGFFRREIAKASFAYQQEIQKNRRLVVGVNAFENDGSGEEPQILYIDPQLEENQKARLARTRANRDALKVEAALRTLEEACNSAPVPFSSAGPDSRSNVMAALVDCARVNATLGEMCDVCRKTYGHYRKLAAV